MNRYYAKQSLPPTYITQLQAPNQLCWPFSKVGFRKNVLTIKKASNTPSAVDNRSSINNTSYIHPSDATPSTKKLDNPIEEVSEYGMKDFKRSYPKASQNRHSLSQKNYIWYQESETTANKIRTSNSKKTQTNTKKSKVKKELNAHIGDAFYNLNKNLSKLNYFLSLLSAKNLRQKHQKHLKPSIADNNTRRQGPEGEANKMAKSKDNSLNSDHIRDQAKEFRATIESIKSKNDKDYLEDKTLMRQINAIALSVPDKCRTGFLSACQTTHAKQYHQYLRQKRIPNTLYSYDFIQNLGHGGFGAVYLVRSRVTQEFFALKQVPKSRVSRPSSRERQYAERNVLSVCDCPSVIRLVKTFSDQTYIYQVCEFLEGGTLMYYMHQQQRFDEMTTRIYMAQLLLAVDAIHQLHYIHRDIKPDNIVFTLRGQLKLLDFGLAKFAPNVFGAYSSASFDSQLESIGISSYATSSSSVSVNEGMDKNTSDHKILSERLINRPADSVLRSICGTPMYTAPEVLLGEGYDHSVDLWSVGVVMFEMLYGGIPFCPPPKYRGDVQTYVKTQVTNYRVVCPVPYPSAVSSILSPEAIDLLQRLICSANTRIKSAREALNHPFFASLDMEVLFEGDGPLAEFTREYAEKHYPVIIENLRTQLAAYNPQQLSGENTVSDYSLLCKKDASPIKREDYQEDISISNPFTSASNLKPESHSEEKQDCKYLVEWDQPQIPTTKERANCRCITKGLNLEATSCSDMRKTSVNDSCGGTVQGNTRPKDPLDNSEKNHVDGFKVTESDSIINKKQLEQNEIIFTDKAESRNIKPSSKISANHRHQTTCLIPKHDINDDHANGTDVDLFFARYSFDRVVVEAQPTVQKILQDPNVRKYLHSSEGR